MLDCPACLRGVRNEDDAWDCPACKKHWESGDWEWEKPAAITVPKEQITLREYQLIGVIWRDAEIVVNNFGDDKFMLECRMQEIRATLERLNQKIKNRIIVETFHKEQDTNAQPKKTAEELWREL